jgi:bifunctional DNA-binding transcriptional regulator/antitoxin component of YhaV-PrlF toxin-antitoxin module
VDTPYGPHRVTANRQVAIPKDLMDRLRLRVGDQIYFMENTDRPGTLMIVPVDLMVRWLEAGASRDIE